VNAPIKHQPATPLPWQSVVTRDAPDAFKRDRHYSDHAANAYPRLVAMLQRAAFDEDYDADDCVKLLRELGELE
jgi:hypothetical protein